MVRALLDGRKTQTRRLASSPLRRCEVGDRLYVRESWRVSPEAAQGWDEADMLGWIDFQAGGSAQVVAPSFQAVEAAAFTKHDDRDWDFLPSRYRPSIHMPRWASRLTLIIEEVRFQRLHDIDQVDAIAEGIEPVDVHGERAWKSYETYADGKPHPHASVPNRSPVTSYRELWDSLHPADGERWQDNPEILALTFRVVRQNIDRIAA
ncbi:MULTISPECIES: hypothetical protein [unclassified Sphingomonas]|uniref:hypothetical protein n=1 Tax=unclassified Sphingomonas TaxID=196159 RepID=UPI00191045AA|nr:MULTISPECIES: hypothetical protein [unclassified Sphingomonas]